MNTDLRKCDLGQPGWQNQFWGTNYPKLLEIRKKWDGDGIFYAQTTVGTEDVSVLQFNFCPLNHPVLEALIVSDQWAEVGTPPKLCKK